MSRYHDPLYGWIDEVELRPTAAGPDHLACPRCHGSGQAAPFEPCLWCNGHGKLRRPPRELGPVLGCSMCEDPDSARNGPSHHGSAWCESGSLASGGTRDHCTCDTCF